MKTVEIHEFYNYENYADYTAWVSISNVYY